MKRLWRPDRLPALAHRDFRTFQVGSFVSNVGNRMQFFGILVHVYNVTQSNTHVGLLGIVRVIPLIVFGLFGGVIADHFDRRKIILVTQVALALVAIAMALVTVMHIDTVWMIYLLVAAGAIANAFNGPARQAMVANLVPARDFPNAASINGITWRLSDLLGPVFFGLIISRTDLPFFSSLAWVYIINAVSFVAVIWAVLLLPARPPSSDERARSLGDALQAIRQGFQFFRETTVVRNTMIVDFWATFFAGAEALLPAFVAHQGWAPATVGILASAMGAGALSASLVTAFLPTVKKQGVWVLNMISLYGVFTIAYGLSVNVVMAYILLACIGATDMISTVLRQTIRQLSTPDYMRGRLSSIGMIFQVSGPQLGDAEAGIAADALRSFGLAPLIAVRTAIIIGGFGSVATGMWWMWRSPLRRYEHEILADPKEAQA